MLLSSSWIGLIFQLQYSFKANARKKYTKIVDREDPPPPHPFLYEPMGKAKKNQPFHQDRVKANEKKKKEENAQRDLGTSAPAVAMKLEKRGRNIDGLYVGEIKAIIFQVYNVLMHGKSKLRKPDYVKNLKDEMTKNIGRYESFVSSATNVITEAPPLPSS